MPIEEEAPEGLHNMQYGLQILSEVLGWPDKGNAELMCDCLTAIQKSKKFSGVQAHKYMTRAIRLAKEQGIEVNRLFFMNGEYMNVRPPKENLQTRYEKIDWEQVRKHQSTPEFEAAWKELQERCSKAFGIPIKARN